MLRSKTDQRQQLQALASLPPSERMLVPRSRMARRTRDKCGSSQRAAWRMCARRFDEPCFARAARVQGRLAAAPSRTHSRVARSFLLRAIRVGLRTRSEQARMAS